MLIEIRKAGFVNKGATLMLYAALQKMKEAYPDADFVMAPSANDGPAPYAKRAELGFLQKAWLWRYGIQWGDLAGLAPRKLREAYGVVLDKDIDFVIDASGFSYSEQWGIGSIRQLADSSKRWRNQGTKVILLPQAMGPFKSYKIKKYIKIAADNVNLIFTRDSISYHHLTDLVGERQNIRIAPDFTNLLEGIVPDYFDEEKHRFCLIPNYRMIDKTCKKQSEAYPTFMIKCAKYLLAKEHKPFILVHEGVEDIMLAKKISEGTGRNLPIIQENNPLKIKGILGACQGTIGSRYHGLVSSLSQGVPALSSGWSHKYKMLFQDYGFPEGMLGVDATAEEIHSKIEILISDTNRKGIKETILSAAQKQKRAASRMWDDVFELIK